jgi:nitrite reductase/ring-hydroxylating ferredoxin subunit
MWKTGYFATTGSCTWSRTNTALGSFTTTAACPGPTVEFDSGSGTLQTTDSDLPKVTVNSVPAGFCKASFTALAQGSTTNYRCFAITDGTTTSGRQCAAGTNAVVFPMSVTGHFSYGSSGNKSFELVNSSDTGSTTVDNATSNAQVYFSISCW